MNLATPSLSSMWSAADTITRWDFWFMVTLRMSVGISLPSVDKSSGIAKKFDSVIFAMIPFKSSADRENVFLTVLFPQV